MVNPMKKISSLLIIVAGIVLTTQALGRKQDARRNLSLVPPAERETLRDAPNSLDGDVKQVVQDLKDDSRNSSAPAVPGAAVQSAAPAASGDANSNVFAQLGADLDHICYDILQKYYYPNKELSNLVTELTYKFEGGFAAICDVNQPLYNFHQLSAGVWRSGRPTSQGLAQLKQQGAKTILDLTDDRPMEGQTINESQAVAAAGMVYQNDLMDWSRFPTDQELDQAMAILTDPAKQPVVFHCTCGRDRTGILAAAYRVVAQGWTPAKAAAEAKTLGWHFPACGDLAGYLSDYAEHRKGGAVTPPPAQ
jgi:protein-tyrosine phosphatase